jgi:hypothetical protein
MAVLLDRYRTSLHALPGVIATGVGQRRCAPHDVLIQIFVKSEEDVERVTRAAARVLGALQVEVIVSGEATAGKG